MVESRCDLELPQLGKERMGGIVHDRFQLSSHPFLCHCLHTVQFHPQHRDGLSDQFIQFVCATAF